MKERNCNMPYPMYGQMPMNPMMPITYNDSCNCNKNNNELENRIDNLEKRVSNLERFMNQNNYNNYQMM